MAMKDVDYARMIGSPGRFSLYTLSITLLLSSSWILSAIPCMAPAYVAPAASEKMGDFRNVVEEFRLSELEADCTTTTYYLGSLILGQLLCALSDQVGRKPIAFYSALLSGFAAVLTGIAPNFWIFLIGRFFQGACFTATTNVNWTIVCESLPRSLHGKAAIIFGVAWVIGYCAVTPIALLFNGWRELFLITSVLTIAYAFAIQFAICESIAFLVINRRRGELAAWIETAEKYGRVKFEQGALDTLLNDGTEESPRKSINWTTICDSMTTMLALLKEAWMDKKMRRNLVISIFMWMADFLVYNALSLTSTGLKFGNPHLNYLMSGSVEILPALVTPMLMNALGRRWTVVLSHAVTGLSLIALTFIPSESGYYIFVWMAAKMGTAASFMILYSYGSELFHIKYRSNCLGACATLGNVGALGAPITAGFGDTYPAGIYYFYAAVSLVSCALVRFLPETKPGRRIDETQYPPIEEEWIPLNPLPVLVHQRCPCEQQ